MTVVDASVVVEALTAGSPLGLAARRRLEQAASLHAPHLIDVEVANALRRLAEAGKVEQGLATTALRQLADLPIIRYPHQPFLARIWGLRGNLSAYDAAYVSVAEAVGGVLVTCDKALSQATGIACDVELVA